MSDQRPAIRDYVEVRRHPTVVRLTDLHATDNDWLAHSFVLTPEVRGHLDCLAALFRRPGGSGIFLIGHYGSGKSHFLAYLSLRLRGDTWIAQPPATVAISLVNFSSANRLEDIVAEALQVERGPGDRRPLWDAMLARHPHGLVLVIDEVSEFLRAKPDSSSFAEDVRFLQYLGEWAQDRRVWILAAMQEGIEHTGELEYGLYRKIKDRYPIRLLLTPAHVRSLIADGILIKKPGYREAVQGVCDDLRAAGLGTAIDFSLLASVYPLHPATLTLLEEVRDRFSQARGVVDFTVTRLSGDTARNIEPFLDQPLGSLLTADVIVDHFRDLLDVQPEFLPVAQQVFPWYAQHFSQLFDRPALRSLAERVLKLLVLVELSPTRSLLTVDEAVAWLSLAAARIDPARNRQVVERLLTTLVQNGRYVIQQGEGYRLELRDDSAATLERLLAREIAELGEHEAVVIEALLPVLAAATFNPLQLARETWLHRRLQWHFHERRYALWAGETNPQAAPTQVEVAICLRMPWGAAAAAPGCFTIVPAPLALSADLIELAALARLRERPHSPQLARRIALRIAARVPLAEQALRAAWQSANLISPEGVSEAAPRLEANVSLDTWLETVVVMALRRRFPAFERFAPQHGPLPKEAWIRLMRFASKEDLGLPLADDFVRLIREAYLVPLGLLRRKGQEYVTPPNLDRHELVSLLTPLLPHHPSPQTVHAHLAQPIYGLVPDQVNLLLVFLLLQGELDIVKDRRSYRDSYEMLPNPLQYDRVVQGHALSSENLGALEHLCRGLGLAVPAQWSALTQRRSAKQLAELGRRHVERLQPVLRQLSANLQGVGLAQRLQRHLGCWAALEKGSNPLHGLEQFLFEVGTPLTFIDDVNLFRELPERMPRLLSETQRYTHLLRHAAVREAAGLGGEAPGMMPLLDDTAAVEAWLQQAGRYYDSYKLAYRESHEHWWRQLGEHALWQWTCPVLARSRHVSLNELVAEIEACQREAQRLRCRGLIDLDFQPQCSCAFDGKGAPVGALIEQFDTGRARLDTELRLFFQQEQVKQKVREWQRQGVESNVVTLAYLDGQAPLPEIADLASFDQFLDGVDLAVEIEASVILDFLGKRLWRADDLLPEFGREVQRLSRAGGARHLRFVQRAAREIPADILAWCGEQALRYAVALPTDLTRGELLAITACLQPQWVTAAALERLEHLGLDDAGVDRVLGWVIDGQVALPVQVDDDSLLAATALLLRPVAIESAPDLARISYRLYCAHLRVGRLAPQLWLRRLDEVAATALPPLPTLVEVLQQSLTAQWVLIDCLGLPLLPAVQESMITSLREFGVPRLAAALVSAPTTTDHCYRDLLAAGIEHRIEKIDVVDSLIHRERLSFPQLAELARLQLDAALRPLLARLDPSRPLLIFADHGFRLRTDGRGYSHGGASTLERVVPLWRCGPR